MRDERRFSWFAAVCLIAMASSHVASATTVQTFFTGQIQQVDSFAPAVVGSSYFGSLVYDSAATLISIGGNNRMYSDPSAQLIIQFDTITVQSVGGLMLEVLDANSRSTIVATSILAPIITGSSATASIFDASLSFDPQQFGPGYALPTALPLSDFVAQSVCGSIGCSWFRVQEPGPGKTFLHRAVGYTDAVSSSPIPEPGTVLLFGVGLAGLAARTRRCGVGQYRTSEVGATKA